MSESWVFGGNDAELGRGLNHLPYTAFVDESGRRRLGVGIGACVLDLSAVAGLELGAEIGDAVRQPELNGLMTLGREAWQRLRVRLQFLLSRDNKDRVQIEQALLPVRDLTLELPCAIGDYTDFYCARDHALRVGELFRPDAPLTENYDWVPIGYHGRASSVVVSGTEVRRPQGQARGAGRPWFGPSERLDYELELAYFVGQGNPLGEPIAIGEAGAHLFGVSLMNDWSARDVQAWEAQPLGPFLGKSFATSVSPWVTPMEALKGSRTAAVVHGGGLMSYLDDARDQREGAIDLRMEVRLSTARSRAAGMEAFCLSRQGTAGLWWTAGQMVAHHTSNGCNLRVGDMLGTGTVSGAARAEAGCLLELTRGGAEALLLPNGESRGFLEDGDEVVMTGWARPVGEMPIRLGECRGRVVAARR